MSAAAAEPAMLAVTARRRLAADSRATLAPIMATRQNQGSEGLKGRGDAGLFCTATACRRIGMGPQPETRLAASSCRPEGSHGRGTRAPAPAARRRSPARRQPAPPRLCALPPLRNRPADAAWEQIVEIDMELDDAAVAVSREVIRRQDRLRADLEVLPGPDDSRLDRADRLSGRYAVDRGRK